jgi:hypothetical protein
MEIIEFNGWKNCIRLENLLVDLVITTDIGPRVIRYGYLDEENEFQEAPEDQGKTGGSQWRPYGGHRLWHAPELAGRTNLPDNDSVAYEDHGDFVRVIQKTEALTGIQKEMDIRLSPVDTHVRVTHRLRNCGVWDVRLAPWALTVMAPGGTAILPLPPRGSHPQDLQPANPLVLWAYTDLSDPRWIWGRQYILARQDPLVKVPQKIGALIPSGWMGYARRSHLFIKKFAYDSQANYPDMGCSAEVFICDSMLELETLGQMQTIPPAAAVEHIEDWYLFRDVPTPHNDSQVERHILTKMVETGV